MRKYSWFVGFWLLSWGGLSAAPASGKEERPKPNLVLILADELGAVGEAFAAEVWQCGNVGRFEWWLGG